MNNYTYEQRKMIAEFLSNLLENNRVEIGNNEQLENSSILRNVIVNSIKELKTVTFGDIKNQAGVRFKVVHNYRIIKHLKADVNLILREDVNIAYELNYFNNNDLVEVINET